MYINICIYIYVYGFSLFLLFSPDAGPSLDGPQTFLKPLVSERRVTRCACVSLSLSV